MVRGQQDVDVTPEARSGSLHFLLLAGHSASGTQWPQSCTFVRMSEDPRSQRERMLAGDWYRADDELHSMARRAQHLADRYAETWKADPSAAREVLGDLLGSLGESTVIRPPLYVDYGVHIRVGARTFVNFGLVALDVAEITIGDDVQIGPNVELLTPVHPLEPGPRRNKLEAAKPIRVGNNVWLGGGAIVCPGVSIGENTVVGAGAVVTKDLPANVLAVGNPARAIREV
jgi:maltose O-acetyltransferase